MRRSIAGNGVHRALVIADSQLRSRVREALSHAKYTQLITAFAVAALLYTAADRSLGGEMGLAVGSIALHFLLALCFVVAAFVTVHSVKPGGAWARLTFFPLRQSLVVAAVIIENSVVAVATSLAFFTPVAVAAMGHGRFGLDAVAVSTITLVLFSVTVVAWTLIVGRVIMAFVSEQTVKYVLEAVAVIAVLLNGVATTGLGTNPVTRWLLEHESFFPTATAGTLLESSVRGQPIQLLALGQQVGWALLPCLLLVVLPMRWSPMGERARGRIARGRAAALVSDAPAFTTRPLLVRAMMTCMYRQFYREPVYLRSVALITGSFLWISFIIARGEVGGVVVAALPGAFAGGVFSITLFLSSFALPMERRNVLQLRLSSLEPAKITAAKSAAAAVYPGVVLLAGLVVSGVWFRPGWGELVAMGVAGAAAALIGGGLGILMGAAYGKFDWTEVSRMHAYPGFATVGFVCAAAMYLAHTPVQRLTDAYASSAYGAFAFYAAILLVMAGATAFACVHLAAVVLGKRTLAA